MWECRDSAHEAEKVAAEIHFLRQPRKTARRGAISASCSAATTSRRALEKALQLLRVPYHLSGGTAFLERDEVKDALSWLRLIANPDDDAAFLRAVQSPKREVGATTLAKLAELAQHAHLPMSRAAESIGVLKQLPPRAANALERRSSTSCATCAARRSACRPAELVRAARRDAPACSRRSARNARTRRCFAAPPAATSTNWPTGSTARSRARGAGRTGRAARAAVARRQGRRRQPGAADEPARARRAWSSATSSSSACEDGTLPHEMRASRKAASTRSAACSTSASPAPRKQLWLSHSREAQRWGDKLRLQAEPLPRRTAGRRTAARRRRSGGRCGAQAGTRRGGVRGDQGVARGVIR